MRIAQTSKPTTRQVCVHPRCHRKWTVTLTLVVLALFLVACGRQIPPYWPDLAVQGEAGDGGIVYVAQVNGQVFALRADDGAVMWSYPTIERRGGGLLGGCSGPVATDGPFHAAPAFNQEFIFLASAGEQQQSLFRKGENRAGLRVLNKLGILQWEFRGSRDRSVAPPAVVGTIAYLPSSDHNVYAIDLDSRQARWTFETDNWVWATPLVVEDMVYVASMDHVLYAVDDASGTEVWRFDGAPGALPAAPAFADGVLYFGSLDGHVYAVRAQTGALLWEKKVDGGVWATPLIRQEEGQDASALYFGTLSGKIYALGTADGSELWQQSVAGEVRGTPAYANGMLYFGCEDGQLYAFDARSGVQGLSPLGQALDRASIYASPAFDGQQLYVVATNGQVFALDPERNETVWQANPLDQDKEEE